jgi:hypothetical protein
MVTGLRPGSCFGTREGREGDRGDGSQASCCCGATSQPTRTPPSMQHWSSTTSCSQPHLFLKRRSPGGSSAGRRFFLRPSASLKPCRWCGWPAAGYKQQGEPCLLAISSAAPAIAAATDIHAHQAGLQLCAAEQALALRERTHLMCEAVGVDVCVVRVRGRWHMGEVCDPVDGLQRLRQGHQVPRAARDQHPQLKLVPADAGGGWWRCNWHSHS